MASSSEDPASLDVQFGHLAIKEDRQTPGVEGVTPGQGTVFKVMSMNVGKNKKEVHAKDDQKGKGPAELRREKVVYLLIKEEPDLVFLQECSSSRELDKKIEELLPSSKCEGNEKGNAEERREEVSDLLDDKKPDIVFLQESSSPTELGAILKEPWKHWKVWEGVIGSNKSYTCIIYNEDKIKVEEHDFHTIHGNLVDKKISNEGQFLTRLFVRRCTSKDDGSLDLLVASYHGRQNREGGKGGLTDEEKKKIFSELLILLDEVCNKADCRVLVGGDFNLKYAKAKEVIKKRSTKTSTQVASSVTSSSRKSNHIEYKYNLYTEGSQGKPMDDMYTKGSQDKPKDDMVDYFMYNGPPGNVNNVRVGMFKDVIALFDHKPLYADFKLK